MVRSPRVSRPTHGCGIQPARRTRQPGRSGSLFTRPSPRVDRRWPGPLRGTPTIQSERVPRPTASPAVRRGLTTNRPGATTSADATTAFRARSRSPRRSVPPNTHNGPQGISAAAVELGVPRDERAADTRKGLWAGAGSGAGGVVEPRRALPRLNCTAPRPRWSAGPGVAGRGARSNVIATAPASPATKATVRLISSPSIGRPRCSITPPPLQPGILAVGMLSHSLRPRGGPGRRARGIVLVLQRVSARFVRFTRPFAEGGNRPCGHAAIGSPAEVPPCRSVLLRSALRLSGPRSPGPWSPAPVRSIPRPGPSPQPTRRWPRSSPGSSSARPPRPATPIHCSRSPSPARTTSPATSPGSSASTASRSPPAAAPTAASTSTSTAPATASTATASTPTP